MRCAECGLYECALRSPMGGCPNGETAKSLGIITTPNTSPHEKADEKTDDHAKLDEAITYLTTRGWTCIVPEGVDAVALYYAARSLVEAVEGYIMPKKGDKYVFRNEVLARCKELKELLK